MRRRNNQKLSVLHMVSSLLIGGAERFVIDLCQQQRHDGLKTKIFSFGRQDDPLVSECNALKLNVFFNRGPKIIALTRLHRILRNADVIHIHSPHVLKFIAPLLPLIGQRKIIYTRHGAAPLDTPTWQLLHKYCEKYIHTITFVSEESQQIFSTNHGWHKKQKWVIDNAVLLPEITGARKTVEDTLSLGSVGRMIDIKNQINLLKALENLTPEVRKKIVVHFFGDGPCLGLLQQFKEEHLPDANVIFHGVVNQRDQIYSSFDVLVVTSETEGLSLAIIEAMASECAVIATDVGGNPRLVSHENTGWLFNYDDSQSLAKIIETCINDRKTVHEYAHRSKTMIEQNFSLQNCANKYKQLYLN
ncbi:glycosyltransferase family 4 protein [Thalassotalea mangrovi]|uniref:Glycosyltransferase family 4 protein n=1 Tax=Thalassotalea mangrovi TaxID=2572245 RepID=A0A4U1B8N5_9GAMM|nr:glycosyltransferase family 4 protein [Thalassotalea mangrovi]TKB46638.1 glycosyltransferase family 4 protein [Thalassotalea mangrovi]